MDWEMCARNQIKRGKANVKDGSAVFQDWSTPSYPQLKATFKDGASCSVYVFYCDKRKYKAFVTLVKREKDYITNAKNKNKNKKAPHARKHLEMSFAFLVLYTVGSFSF